ncbi:MAG: cytochrome c5 family protein [Pseudomonadales bacterium]|nr:cytochrome c5 family protein [Pseudomonadales bacterium]
MKKTLLVAAVAMLGFGSVAQADEIQGKYQATCFACHGTGAAGAPMTGNKEQWATRLELGMDVLVASVKNGKGAMPPTGLCGDCTDDQYKALITFMTK